MDLNFELCIYMLVIFNFEFIDISILGFVKLYKKYIFYLFLLMFCFINLIVVFKKVESLNIENLGWFNRIILILILYFVFMLIIVCIIKGLLYCILMW